MLSFWQYVYNNNEYNSFKQVPTTLCIKMQALPTWATVTNPPHAKSRAIESGRLMQIVPHFDAGTHNDDLNNRRGQICAFGWRNSRLSLIRCADYCPKTFRGQLLIWTPLLRTEYRTATWICLVSHTPKVESTGRNVSQTRKECLACVFVFLFDWLRIVGVVAATIRFVFEARSMAASGRHDNDPMATYRSLCAALAN